MERRNDMLKTIGYTFFVCSLAYGLLWYSIGRNDINEIRSDFNRSYEDFQRVQRTVGELGDNSNGFAREISEISSGSRRAEVRSRTIIDRTGIIDGEVRFIAGEVDQLEEWNRQSLILGRDLGDVSYELRRLSEASRETE